MKKPQPLPKLKKGFACISRARRIEIASMGGKAAMSKPGHAKELGRRGGLSTHATHKLVRVKGSEK